MKKDYRFKNIIKVGKALLAIQLIVFTSFIMDYMHH